MEIEKKLLEDLSGSCMGGYIDHVNTGGNMVNVGSFSVDPSQNALNMNQPLFLHVSTNRWCTFAGITGAGLTIRYDDGTLASGVPPHDVANLGIQA